jgi:hypothetical protein
MNVEIVLDAIVVRTPLSRLEIVLLLYLSGVFVEWTMLEGQVSHHRSLPWTFPAVALPINVVLVNPVD